MSAFRRPLNVRLWRIVDENSAGHDGYAEVGVPSWWPGKTYKVAHLEAPGWGVVCGQHLRRCDPDELSRTTDLARVNCLRCRQWIGHRSEIVGYTNSGNP
jgi:hypothetical protein